MATKTPKPDFEKLKWVLGKREDLFKFGKEEDVLRGFLDGDPDGFRTAHEGVLTEMGQLIKKIESIPADRHRLADRLVLMNMLVFASSVNTLMGNISVLIQKLEADQGLNMESTEAKVVIAEMKLLNLIHAALVLALQVR